MEIESIGNAAATNSAVTNNNSVSQEEFIKLFLAQLNYQDPMEPVNNREFLAQLAQFSSLEQSRLSNENLTALLAMNSSNQALTLLGKTVEVTTNTNSSFNGTIEAVHYSASGPSLTIKSAEGTFLDNITLGQVKIIQN
ncbi:flagellar hook capping protein [Pseudoalteromonas sp. SMS1]|uniref:flagellar hook assembly protein FlgD n=1 Tax=Pseudoalteromonas sp. SMS1 TaxID=2908894 RepID=UPI001F15C928|nr:flagellar hook capping FlgD N-terminal domain-containing protein [Pseudoalteromonas sp. SMS1]MCF2860228.1 flagellar hook capping protein [Pseudoalteromonas sp. SMS1]